MDKISVKEYMENKALLQLTGYTPYTEKLRIAKIIITQCSSVRDGLYTMDCSMLDRVKTQLFIEMCTNLDLNIECEGFEGYDYLLMNNLLFEIKELIGNEYDLYDEVLKTEYDSYVLNNMNLQRYVDYKVMDILKTIDYKVPALMDQIREVDIQTIMEKIGFVLDLLGGNKSGGK